GLEFRRVLFRSLPGWASGMRAPMPPPISGVELLTVVDLATSATATPAPDLPCRSSDGDQSASTLKVESDGPGPQALLGCDRASHLVGDDGVDASGQIIAEVADAVDSPGVEISPLLMRLGEHATVVRPIFNHYGTFACCGQVADLEADYICRGSFRIQAGNLFDQLPVEGLDHVGVIGVEFIQLLCGSASESGPLVAVGLSVHEEADTSGVGRVNEFCESGD